MQNIIQSFHNKEFVQDSKKNVITNITSCVSNNPDAYGVFRCRELGIKCEILPHKDFKNREEFDKALLGLVQRYSPDLVILAGFMRILTPVFTSQIKCINIHPSLLPQHKGANAIKDTYDSDDEQGGVSVHWVNDVLDGGEIILQDSIPKISGESFESFEKRIHSLEYSLYPQAILQVLNLTSVIKNG
ncbi:phosphoribosylglycinamide formyltransferase [Helicobacter sp. 12S02232-10]|nr:phosphoribosylglycinamide formyltransferase [Helicobacter sp. 12S02232-10]